MFDGGLVAMSVIITTEYQILIIAYLKDTNIIARCPISHQIYWHVTKLTQQKNKY